MFTIYKELWFILLLSPNVRMFTLPDLPPITIEFSVQLGPHSLLFFFPPLCVCVCACFVATKRRPRFHAWGARWLRRKRRKQAHLPCCHWRGEWYRVNIVCVCVCVCVVKLITISGSVWKIVCIIYRAAIGEVMVSRIYCVSNVCVCVCGETNNEWFSMKRLYPFTLLSFNRSVVSKIVLCKRCVCVCVRVWQNWQRWVVQYENIVSILCMAVDNVQLSVWVI